MDKALYNAEKFTTDDIRAVDAKFEAQKIAFAPLAFQAIRTMIDLNILRAIESAGDKGITRAALAEKTGVSEYGVGVLCEMALGMNVIKLTKDSIADGSADAGKTEKFIIGKIGWMLLEDDLTKVNFNFTNDICYMGAYENPQASNISARSGRRSTKRSLRCPTGQNTAGSRSIIFTAISLFRKRCLSYSATSRSISSTSAATPQSGLSHAARMTKMYM